MTEYQPFADEAKERRYQAHRLIFSLTGQTLERSARRSESARRMGFVEPIRAGAQVWVAPLWDWSKRDCNEYIDTNKLPRNEVAGLLCMSGECLCGAFAKPKEFDWVAKWYPAFGQQIRELEKEAEAAGVPCKWGQRPSKNRHKKELLFMPMCAGCELK